MSRPRRAAAPLLAAAAAFAAGGLAVGTDTNVHAVPRTRVEPAPAMAAAGRTFLAGLDAALRKRAQLPFDSPDRTDWHYVPRSRAGVALKELSTDQRSLALALLQTGVSPLGFAKLEAIRDLEEVLHARSGWSMRDPGLFHFAVFGEPADGGTWAWRYEGHHASLHWTIVGGKLAASAPQFLGANPAQVREGPHRGLRALAPEEDVARELVKSLNAAQRSLAILGDRAPGDILTRNSSPEATPLDQRGIPYERLDPWQRQLLLKLLHAYIETQNAAAAGDRLQRIDADRDRLRFAWMGGIEPGQGHYYRIQGGDFLVEYDNTQDGANHIHSVWRDKRGEWGRDLLAEHYRGAFHHAPQPGKPRAAR